MIESETVTGFTRLSVSEETSDRQETVTEPILKVCSRDCGGSLSRTGDNIGHRLGAEVVPMGKDNELSPNAFAVNNPHRVVGLRTVPCLA
jgi:hypothetical protein